jgi:hypothetical protein
MRMVSGAVHTDEDLHRLRRAVRRADQVVAVGTCAISGGRRQLGNLGKAKEVWMKNNLLLGLWRLIVPIPGKVWQGQISKNAEDTLLRLDFMSDEHHRVRDFAVRELPRVGRPLAPEFIAQGVVLPLDRVITILDELEKNMTFLYRGDGTNVTWAYPVTVDQTPHKVTFSSGEQIHAA